MTLLPIVDAPGMTIQQFDALNHKAHMLDLRITERVGAVAFVTSASHPGQVHRVTRHACSCKGHRFTGRCCHRAYVIFVADVMGGFGRPQPAPAVAPAPVNFLHRRGTVPPAA